MKFADWNTLEGKQTGYDLSIGELADLHQENGWYLDINGELKIPDANELSVLIGEMAARMDERPEVQSVSYGRLITYRDPEMTHWYGVCVQIGYVERECECGK